MFKLKNKLFSIILTVILVLSLNAAAFAAWPSFQNDNTNNGVITTQPPITKPATAAVTLPTSGTIGTDVYSGVDTTSVISDGGIAYTVYNGGISSGYNGGARLHATNLSTAATVFDIRLDTSADNVQQLSTPYLDGTTLYAATTFYNNRLVAYDSTGWSGSAVSGSSFSFPNGSSTITYSGMVTTAGFWQSQLMLSGISVTNGLSGTLTLTNTSTGTAYTFTGSQYNSNNLTLYSGTLIPAGTYNLSLAVTNSAGSAVTVQNIEFLTSAWNLWKVDLSNPAPPVPELLKTGQGQANTPISYDTLGNIYWGIDEGDRSYYQMNKLSGAVTPFTPSGGDDFYYAGAVVVAVDGGNYAVFGGDNGVLYVLNASGFSQARAPISLAGVAASGKVRSTIIAPATNDDYIYFTSAGSASSQGGYLWAAQKATLLDTQVFLGYSIIKASQSSVSTPVVSSNGILYVGSSQDFSLGTVQAFDPSSITSIANGPIAQIYSGDPVQSSPIVYSENDGTYADDYVYFTTNSGNGAGYCYLLSKVILTGVITTSQEWTYANIPAPTGNPYSVQGMASDSGYVVWGDDGNNLYITH
jgi:hypothetical protein